MASIAGRTVILSGATGVIGRAIAEGVLSQPNTTLILPLRSPDAARALVAELAAKSSAERVFWEPCNLADFSSVRSFCEIIGTKYGGRVDTLINNAAVVPATREMTVDGIEQQWQVNVLSYFWFMQLLAPYLQTAAEQAPEGSVRVVNVASRYAGELDFTDLEFVRRPYNPNSAYRQSKQANRMMTAAAATHLCAASTKILVNSCHPGVVESPVLIGLGFGSGFNSATDSATTPLHLAFSDQVTTSGQFYYNSKIDKCKFSTDSTAVDRLWHILAEQTEQVSKTN